MARNDAMVLDERETPRESYFDFIVAERPVYVPGSGPPLAPLTIEPVHDKTGVIECDIQINKETRYVVTYKEHPGLRVSVMPINILNWVSPRTFENFEYEQVKEAERLQQEAAMPKSKKTAKIGSRVIQGVSKSKPSRKRKRSPAPEAPVKRRAPRVRTTVPPIAPGKTRSSAASAAVVLPQKTLLKSPRQRGLADMLPSETEEDDDDLISKQLTGNMMGTLSRSRLMVEISRSPTTSPDPLQSSRKASEGIPNDEEQTTTVPNFIQDQPRTASVASGVSNDAPGPSKRISPPSIRPKTRDSVASVSSRDAFAAYEEMERQHQKQARSAPIANMCSQSRASTPVVGSERSTPPVPSVRRPASNGSNSGKPRSIKIPAGYSPWGRSEKHSRAIKPNTEKEASAQSTASDSSQRQLHPRSESISQKRPTSSGSIVSRYSALAKEKEAAKANKHPIIISLESTPSETGSNQRRSAKAKPSQLPPPPPPPQPKLGEDEETEWEVDELLADELREDHNGDLVRHYLVKWVGTFDDTWEPIYNVGNDARKTYDAKKRQKKGKGKEIEGRRGVGGDGTSDDARPGSRGRDVKGKGSEAEPIKPVKRVEVIIITDSEDEV